jgi:hypothetical protein
MISKIVASAKWWSTGASRGTSWRQAVEQVLQPQHRADAFVERVLVQDQGGFRQSPARLERRSGRGGLFHSPAHGP